MYYRDNHRLLLEPLDQSASPVCTVLPIKHPSPAPSRQSACIPRLYHSANHNPPPALFRQSAYPACTIQPFKHAPPAPSSQNNRTPPVSSDLLESPDCIIRPISIPRLYYSAIQHPPPTTLSQSAYPVYTISTKHSLSPVPFDQSASPACTIQLVSMPRYTFRPISIPVPRYTIRPIIKTRVRGPLLPAQALGRVSIDRERTAEPNRWDGGSAGALGRRPGHVRAARTSCCASS